MVWKLKNSLDKFEKISYVQLWFLIFVFLNFFTSGVKAATRDTNSSVYHSIIYVTVSPVFEMSRSDFFDVYNSTKFFGGKKSKFSPSGSFGIGTKIDFMDQFRFGLEFTYISASLQENIIQPISSTDVKGSRSLSEQFKYDNMPLLLTGEYIPYQSQFRTYVGSGIGVSISNLEWNELVKSSSIDHDKRTGGDLLSESTALPLFRIYAGLDLGFDKMYKDSFLGSLILEVRYTKVFGSIDIFRKFKNQFAGDPVELDRTYSPIPDYLELAMAVTFNFKIGKH